MFWTPRAVRGAIFLTVGAFAFKLEPLLTQALSQSLFWTGLSQAGLSLTGLICVCTGVYLLATRYKNS
jgi:hypothetical protein